MGNTAFYQLCRDGSRLSSVQIQILEKSCAVLPFASDLSQRDVTVFVRGKEENMLLIAAAATPLLKRYSGVGRNIGMLVPAREEPLADYVFAAGTPLIGAAERRYGKTEPFLAYPFVDNAGAVIAVIAFSGIVEEAHSRMLTDTAFMALQIPQENGEVLYQSLSLQDGIILVDGDGTVVYANEMAKQIVSLLGKGSQIEGRYVYESGLTLPLAKEALQSREGTAEEVCYGKVVLAQRSIPLLQSGKLERLILIVTDKTVLKEKEKELLVKNSVIKEIHHRVKNNLQTIASILRMQLRRVVSSEAKEALQEALQRILSIALIHEILSHHEEEVIDMDEVLQKIISLLAPSLAAPGQQIQFSYQGMPVVVSSKKATSLAVVVNELLTNAVLHGLKDREKGLVAVQIKLEGARLLVQIKDDGVGMQAEAAEHDAREHLGMKIIHILVTEELHGTVRYEGNEPSGTTVYIDVPAE